MSDPVQQELTEMIATEKLLDRIEELKARLGDDWGECIQVTVTASPL